MARIEGDVEYGLKPASLGSSFPLSKDARRLLPVATDINQDASYKQEFCQSDTCLDASQDRTPSEIVVSQLLDMETDAGSLVGRVKSRSGHQVPAY
jgi:hypothetical protein